MKSHKAIKLSLIGSVTITVIIIASLYVGNLLGLTEFNSRNYWFVSMVSMISSFIIIYVFIKRYLYQRLQPIYDNLISHKNENYHLEKSKKIKSEDIAEEINKKLTEWEQDKKEEINHLVKLELFRKEFLGNVSHELKTPIFSVQGYVHTLLDGGIEDHEINLLYLKKAAKSIDRLINIVDDLESISKIESRDLLIERQTFDINELVKETIESLELLAKEKDIKLIVEPAYNKASYVSADKNAIRQVLVNLVVNSIKYGNEKGETKISYTKKGTKVLVHVKDNGIGISDDSQSRLFERFYRVDKSRSREQGGTGLGLAICKHIIEAHGETIGVNSEPGKGSTFSFSLSEA